MKVSLWLFFASIVFVGCTRNDEIKDFDILTSRDWYRYKTEIIAVDTVTTTPINYSGTPVLQVTITYTDTTLYADDCIQSATLSLKASGQSHLENPCNLMNPAIDTVWSNHNGSFYGLTLNDTTLNNYYFYRFPFLGPSNGSIDMPYTYVVTQGHFISITKNEFSYNTQNSTFKFAATDVNFLTVTTGSSKETVTFKSR